MKTLIEHWKANEDLFNFWISRHEKLQISNDLLKPFIEPFKESNPTVNINSCQDCLIDMLIWVRMIVKEVTKEKTKKK